MIRNWLDDWEFLNVLESRRNSPIIAEAADRIERLLKHLEQNPKSDSEPEELPPTCPVCEATLREENV